MGNTTFSLDGSGNYTYSVATQDGDLANLANKLQLLKSSSTAAIDLANHNFGSNPINMVSMMAIGHFNLLKNNDPATPCTGAVTVTGGLATTALDAKNGTLGTGTANTITLGAGTTGERYMALIPGSQTLSFAADGVTATIATQEVQANKLYDQLNVNMEALEPVFSVGPCISDKVVFSPGNLYWDGAFEMESNQWGFANTWSSGHVSHFYWSNTNDWQASGMEPYAEEYLYSAQNTSDVFFTNNPDDAGSPNPDFTVEEESGT